MRLPNSNAACIGWLRKGSAVVVTFLVLNAIMHAQKSETVRSVRYTVVGSSWKKHALSVDSIDALAMLSTYRSEAHGEVVGVAKDLAVDLGSGTSLIAAEQLGRRCFGMELDPAYCDVTVQRWEALTGREAIKES